MEEESRSAVLYGDGADAALEQDISNVEAFSLADWPARSDHRRTGAGTAGIDHSECRLAAGDDAGSTPVAKSAGRDAAQHCGNAKHGSRRHQHCDRNTAQGATRRQRQRFRKDRPGPAVFGQEPTGLEEGRFRGDLRQDQGSHRRSPKVVTLQPSSPLLGQDYGLHAISAASGQYAKPSPLDGGGIGRG